MARKVLVTGGTGYIAGYIIRQLIVEGWEVNTTVRSLSKEAKLREILDVDNGRLHVFAADLMSDDGWADAMATCTHVAHVASPLPAATPKHEDDLIVPARDGALRALRYAKDAGVERVVMTSSMAAVAYGVGRGTHHFDESHWSNIDHPDAYPYVKSKTIAEREARKWMTENGGSMEYCSINPGMVLGPQMSDDFSTSLEAVKKLLEGAFPGTPDLGFAVVDVRDVADLHVKALTASDMDGERFLAAGKFFKMREIADLLIENLGKDARKVPKRNLPDWVMKFVGKFDPVAASVVSELGKVRIVDSGHARGKLGWTMRPEEDSVLDTARDLIARGIVKV
ncbi:aldehyde reductase [Sphingorhabdus sp. Alg239-R122]|uniref:SDR family oxidoreductase n=1 Tax=Sphingorhabdus sp. Alg239-R122 TaxID=2305989 RepID=UPI0013DAB4D1|nr:aldehyde reductase [Sphingorhabdus sp. Alg239-R122]